MEPKIGAGSSLGYLMFLHRKDPTLMQELLQQASPLLKESLATAPDNPRLHWVLGPIRWSSPPERGGGQDKAFEIYNKGLEALRNQKRGVIDPLEPSWGEPELLMNLAWSNLNRTTPDLKAADQYAQAALKLVPYWHYVRDILMPQIQAAEAKADLPVAGSAFAQTQDFLSVAFLQNGSSTNELDYKRRGSWGFLSVGRQHSRCRSPGQQSSLVTVVGNLHRKWCTLQRRYSSTNLAVPIGQHLSRDGGTGRRSGLKIRRYLVPWGFDSPSRHQP